MPHADGAVLQVAIVKSEARIDQNLLDSAFGSELGLPPEIVVHQLHWIGSKIELRDLAHIWPLDVADDDGGAMRGDHPVDFFGAARSGEIDDSGAGFQGRPGYGGVIGFD